MKPITRFYLPIWVGLLFFQCDIMGDVDDLLDPSNGHFVSFKVDGVQKEYKHQNAGLFSKILNDDSGEYNYLFGGFRDHQDTERNTIGAMFFDSNANVSEFKYPDGGPYHLFESFSYSDENGVNYYAGHLWDINGEIESSYSFQITSRNQDTCEGTFAAKLYSQEAKKYIEITEGKFKLYFVEEQD